MEKFNLNELLNGNSFPRAGDGAHCGGIGKMQENMAEPESKSPPN